MTPVAPEVAARPDRRRLAHLLRAARSPLDADGVVDLVAGVLAAPAEIGDSWHQLVADPTPPALAEALEELRAQMAAGDHDGSARGGARRPPRGRRLPRALLRLDPRPRPAHVAGARRGRREAAGGRSRRRARARCQRGDGSPRRGATSAGGRPPRPYFAGGGSWA